MNTCRTIYRVDECVGITVYPAPNRKGPLWGLCDFGPLAWMRLRLPMPTHLRIP